MKLLSLRLPDELHAALKMVAAKEHRSLNAEIIHIIEAYIEQYIKTKEQKQQG